MAVTGGRALISGLSEAFDMRKAEVEATALNTARQALRIFRQQQYSAPHISCTKAVADNATKRGKAIAYAKAHQGGEVRTMGIPWFNRSFRAARTVFADAGIKDSEVYFNMYHTMSYGVYLELANNRKHAVIEPIVRSLAPDFIERLKKIYAS